MSSDSIQKNGRSKHQITPSGSLGMYVVRPGREMTEIAFVTIGSLGMNSQTAGRASGYIDKKACEKCL